MIADAVAARAARQPEAVAVLDRGRPVTYAGLDLMAGRFAAAIGRFGLPPGAIVALECGDMLLHLTLIMACERLRLCTVSFSAREFDTPQLMLAEADLAITEHPLTSQRVKRHHMLSKAWLAEVAALPPVAAAAGALPGDVLRIVRTSGTTGTPKHVAMTRALFAARTAVHLKISPSAPGHRHLSTLPFSVHASISQAAGALTRGATLVFDPRPNLGEALAANQITRTTLLPITIRDLLDRLPAGFARPPDLTIVGIAGRIPSAQRRQLLERVATRMLEYYGSNEMGIVSMIESDGPESIGTVLPDVAVEILDEQGRPLPNGQIGQIRVRSPSVAAGYLNDPDITARMFQGGWFYPGDLGVLHENNVLEVIGRDDDILNLGGLKVVLGPLEERLRANANVADLAVCVLRAADGADELHVAVCGDLPAGPELAERLRPAFAGFPFGHATLVKLDRIPRTETRKVQREPLRRAVAKAVAAGGGVAAPISKGG